MTTEPETLVGYLGQDLMFSSKLSGAVAQCQARLATGANCAALKKAAKDATPCLVLVDLTLPNMDIQQCVDELRQAFAGKVAVVGFGPHVHEAKLAAAKEAGCDQVKTRGQIHQELPTLLAQYCGKN